ncbi:DUF7282 domain-containing protein [Halococcus saccharolyticus]|uniref:DUF7282 domain-containing protein n=1 Tax=Halococcus saccharolyticus DSM 5350 TaxID=1227455 RepID=M0MHY2_9EURY|nr:hypothetical protein [Halococcus saccharolyticus]EMA44010.1 hypothetical protein C449_10798 [Halococcus saccharolyticus DSM 5350]
MTSIRRRSALLLAVLAAAALAMTTGVAGSVPAISADGVALQADDTNATTNASITVANQTRDGRSIAIEAATLPDGGFVLLEAAGPNGSVVGVSLPLSAGTHEGRVTLRGVPGADANVSRLGTNTTLVATLHRDTDGDDRFDGLVAADTDGSYTANGSPVAERVRVTVPPDERPTNATLAFPNQTTNGSTVTVGPVTLPEGGYVGVHRSLYNDSNATESAIGATDYLEPGSYTNVTVPVSSDDSGLNATAQDRSVRLSAAAYSDSDGDREFQYVPSNGSEDEPYTDDGTVNDSGVVTIEAPDTTETPSGNVTTQPTTENGTQQTTPVESTTTAPQPSSTTPTPDTPTPTTTQTTEATEPATSTPDPASGSDHETTAYGGGSDGREGILDNPLFPVLALVFAVFVVLVAVTGQ